MKLVGEQATELFADAQKMLQKIVSEKLLTAKAIFGIFLLILMNKMILN
jgi:5-methyltetrahydrofolate--homocysteine methyltransferase